MICPAHQVFGVWKTRLIGEVLEFGGDAGYFSNIEVCSNLCICIFFPGGLDIAVEDDETLAKSFFFLHEHNNYEDL